MTAPDEMIDAGRTIEHLEFIDELNKAHAFNAAYFKAEYEKVTAENKRLEAERDELKALSENHRLCKKEPVAWIFSKGPITKLDVCPHGGNWKPLYRAKDKEQLANQSVIQTQTATETESLQQQLALSNRCLKSVREACLYPEDDGSIGITQEPYIDSQLFDDICKALAATEQKP